MDNNERTNINVVVFTELSGYLGKLHVPLSNRLSDVLNRRQDHIQLLEADTYILDPDKEQTESIDRHIGSIYIKKNAIVFVYAYEDKDREIPGREYEKAIAEKKHPKEGIIIQTRPGYVITGYINGGADAITNTREQFIALNTATISTRISDDILVMVDFLAVNLDYIESYRSLNETYIKPS